MEVKRIERKTLLGWERYLVVNGVVVRLSEFPSLRSLVSTEPRKDTGVGNAEDLRR